MNAYLTILLRLGIAVAIAYYGFTLFDSDNSLSYGFGFFLAVFFGFSTIKLFIALTTLSTHSARQLDFDTVSKEVSNTHGQARLARQGDAVIQTLSARNGFFLGLYLNNALFFNPFARGMGNMVTYAPARGGKTTGVVMPAALHWYGGSLYLPDIKAEVAAISMEARRANGQHVILWNPFNVLGLGGKSFNPLYILVKDISINQGKNLHEHALLIGNTLIPYVKETNGFFRKGARRFLISLLLYLAVFEKGQCHLPGLRNLVWASTERKQEIAEIMKYCNAYGGLLKDYGNHLAELVDPTYIKTFGAMRDYAIDATQIFDSHTDFGKSLMGHDFELADLLNGHTTFHPIIPEEKLDSHGSIIGLISALLFEMIAGQAKPSPVMMLMEEFGNIGRISNIKKAVTLLGGKGLRVWFILQSRQQLIDLYDNEIASLIEGQCSMIQQWSIRDPEDRKRWSERCGKTTVKSYSMQHDPRDPLTPWKPSIGESAKSVLSNDAIGTLPDDIQLIAISGQPIIAAKIVPYFQIEPWRSQARRNPYHPGGYPKDKPILLDLRENNS